MSSLSLTTRISGHRACELAELRESLELGEITEQSELAELGEITEQQSELTELGAITEQQSKLSELGEITEHSELDDQYDWSLGSVISPNPMASYTGHQANL
ncbi:hypothetical protein PSHT_00829 [Puccinia striiformis]|uniref:Uncharacterized protein n=2 Tax=Puccinia striiformis TaxID=27350 RepID=A0A0L0VWZ1_9BASI|nr:hypothetical protein H4Q26_003574 [Puccinia striiformis f. sp. tritici PST-130]KAI9612392.1 hypothetical protein KEM48_004123 [Puccinia striiformis f. sp. tritici PST-130]KNF03510.1 hypothetical protein PSTG_03445 [Puccinia striiformis f. sp. tritici PST-78]POW22851.1 hypothetical protein PSHT_00829 [Puccinia striiformis]